MAGAIGAARECIGSSAPLSNIESYEQPLHTAIIGGNGSRADLRQFALAVADLPVKVAVQSAQMAPPQWRAQSNARAADSVGHVLLRQQFVTSLGLAIERKSNCRLKAALRRWKKDKRMDRSMMKGIAVGGVAMVVLGAGAVTGYQTLTKPKFAEVVAAKEVFETAVTPREQCEDVQVQHQAPVKDQNRIAGTAIGAVAGGLLGSTIGGGKGKTLATVGGAAAGGYAGNQVQKSMQEKDVTTTTERRCKTVQDKSRKLVGYDVTYRLDGKQDVVRTSFKPGATLPVKDGKVVTTPTEAAKS